MSLLRKVTTVASVAALAFVGVAVTMPAAGAASTYKEDTVSLTIGETLLLTLTGTGEFGNVSVGSANVAAQNANVKSNFAAGYTLVLEDVDSNTSLVGTTSTSNTIPSVAAPTGLATGASTSLWGACLGASTTTCVAATGNFLAMPANATTPIQIASTVAISAAAGDDYPVTYGAQISGSQAPDTYEDVVIYTLTSK